MSCHSHDDPEIWIILSTHDAGHHLKAQIESIRNQSYSSWRLLIRDDASTDSTVNQVEDYAQSEPRITFLSANQNRRFGVSASYSSLIEAALAEGAQWIAFSDQDDVWSPTKLEHQAQILLEKSLTPDQPWLLHTDLQVVDENLGPISNSFLEYAGLSHVATDPLRTLIIQNFVTGCSCLFSRGLAERAVPIPQEAIMHDWWLALNAAALGQIDFLSTPTAQYRQHPGNQIGAKKYRDTIAALIGRSIGFRKSDMNEFVRVVEQVRVFHRHLQRDLIRPPDQSSPREALQLTEDFLSLFAKSVSRLDRVRGLRRLGISRQDPIRNTTLQVKLLMTSFPTAKE